MVARAIGFLLWISVILGAAVGSFLFVEALINTSGESREAAGATALCIAVLPYVVARAWAELRMLATEGVTKHVRPS